MKTKTRILVSFASKGIAIFGGISRPWMVRQKMLPQESWKVTRQGSRIGTGRPAPHRTRGQGMEFRPRPTHQSAGPRTGNGAGDHFRGPTQSAATGPRYFEPISRRKCEFPAYVKQQTYARLPKIANIDHPAYVKCLIFTGNAYFQRMLSS